MEKFRTCAEVAELFGVRKKTVYEWVKKGKLVAFYTGKVYRFRPEDIEKCIKSGMTNKVVN
jgi:excisionase family DNA binding protein